jgi:hypothetical protein
MKPTNFNQLKNYLQVGMKLKLVDTSMKNHKYLGVERAIIKKQTNSIKFEGGSWMGLGSMGEKASDFTFQENGFTYTETWELDGVKKIEFLKYEYIA